MGGQLHTSGVPLLPPHVTGAKGTDFGAGNGSEVLVCWAVVFPGFSSVFGVSPLGKVFGPR